MRLLTQYISTSLYHLVADEKQVASDFLGFLSNLVKVFPSLSTRPLYLAGESYAGMYIVRLLLCIHDVFKTHMFQRESQPYIAQAILSSPSPVKLAGISLADATMTYFSVFQKAGTLQVIETFPMLINYDVQVFNIFKEL